ncbi:ABC transporter substrate-binding protein [Saccharibacillus sp. CPCC 101409]|uniref:ABC transporter substrate-binding protein n=1 Tax=Saccharibacillus sp. CPCC 101409 TaxID=3058041 RepID=UPI0026737F30|nr:ABC transporter substrate-binding protein [Saccharibacillus sp. CPCC 101409]MDO3413350.1 ABC transporter substrate-binding protein [Saccharibacillus sp. CPCC 101409]
MNKRKWMAAAAAALTMGLLAGCGGPSGKETDGAAEGDPTAPISFSFFGADPNPNWNNMQDAVGKAITEKTGVTINAEFAVADPSQKLALVVASGEYPELLSAKGDVDKFIEAGAMLDLTDLIDKYAPNIKKVYGDQLKRLRYSNEDQSIYVLPTYSAVGTKTLVAGAGFELQHKAVKEAGYPEVKTLEDYEKVIRDYVAKHPTDEQGNPTIGMTLNADDWHMSITVTNPAAEVTGKSGDGEYYIDPKTYEATYHYRTEGEKEYFKWLNRMYNDGLLDKDTFVQKNDQYLAKVSSGRVVGIVDADWGYAEAENSLKSAGKYEDTYGHYSVTLSDRYKDNRMQSTGFMSGWGVGITTACKDPVRAIKFLDYLASDEAQIMNNWGIEGEQYQVEDGKRVVPADVQDRITNDNSAFSRETGLGFYSLMSARYGDGVQDPSGNYYTKNTPDLISANYSEADKETLAAYDAKTWMDLFPNEDEFPVKPWGAAWNIAVPSSDNVTLLTNQMKDITWKRIPEMVVAKPEKFDGLWDAYQQELIDGGVEKMEQGFTRYVQDLVKLWNN